MDPGFTELRGPADPSWKDMSTIPKLDDESHLRGAATLEDNPLDTLYSGLVPFYESPVEGPSDGIILPSDLNGNYAVENTLTPVSPQRGLFEREDSISITQEPDTQEPDPTVERLMHTTPTGRKGIEKERRRLKQRKRKETKQWKRKETKQEEVLLEIREDGIHADQGGVDWMRNNIGKWTRVGDDGAGCDDRKVCPVVDDHGVR